MKQYKISVNDKEYVVSIEETTLGQATETVAVKQEVEATPIKETVKPEAKFVSPDGAAVKAPMPGSVLAVKVNNGDRVKSGDVLILLEAMKMENEIVATKDGVVKISVKVGDKINSGDVIAVIAEEEK